MHYLSEVFNLNGKKRNYCSRTKKKCDYEESDLRCLFGNMQYGIERTKTGKDVFYIKNFKETQLEINQAKAQYKYEKQHIFVFSQSDIISINYLYDKYSKKMPQGILNNYSDKNFTSRYDELDKVLSYIQKNNLDKKDENRIKHLQSKISVKINECDEDKAKLAEDKTAKQKYDSEQENQDVRNKERDICIRYGDKFSKKEYKYKEWVTNFIDRPEGVQEFLNEANKLRNGDNSSLLLTEYIKLYGSNPSLNETLIESFMEAGYEIMEEYDE